MGLVSAEEFKRRRDVIEKGLVTNPGQLEHNHLRKRKPTEATLKTLIKTKNLGQLSFADEVDQDEQIYLPKKEKKVEVVKELKKEIPIDIVASDLPKARINLLEEDDETKRQKQEALEVVIP